MNIAIIGTGNVGTGLAKVLSKTRHGVVFGARTEDKGHAAADAFVKEYGYMLKDDPDYAVDGRLFRTDARLRKLRR